MHEFDTFREGIYIYRKQEIRHVFRSIPRTVQGTPMSQYPFKISILPERYFFLIFFNPGKIMKNALEH